MSDVRFVRINGRVVPIKNKSGAPKKKKSSGPSVLKTTATGAALGMGLKFLSNVSQNLKKYEKSGLYKTALPVAKNKMMGKSIKRTLTGLRSLESIMDMGFVGGGIGLAYGLGRKDGKK